MSKEKRIESTDWLTRDISKEQLEREKQEAVMSADLAFCHTEFATGVGEIYTDYDVTAQKMFAKGYRKQSENTVELPCKIGDTVYIIDECGDGECSEDYVLAVKVTQFFINKHGIAVDLELPIGLRQNSWMVVGKNVFLTEDEAEQALAKMKGGAE